MFAGLPTAELQTILDAGRRRALANDDYLFYQGDPAEAAYVVLAGRLRLSQLTPDGQEVLIRFVGPGDPIAIAAAFKPIPYPISAQAVEASEVLLWDRETLASLMAGNPRLAMNTMQTLQGRVGEFQDRVRELQTERVERRVARALLRLARQAGRKVEDGVLIDHPVSRQDLAEMTGTTLYTVSRTLSQWEQAGIVESGRERVLIRQPHRLVVIAEDLPVDDKADRS